MEYLVTDGKVGHIVNDNYLEHVRGWCTKVLLMFLHIKKKTKNTQLVTLTDKHILSVCRRRSWDAVFM